jgi:DNA-binding transcriptional LysR family regulator
MDRLTGMQVFARVVETGSFSRAAKDLNMTQPSVTKHVAAIEQALKSRLLNRNTRGVSITETGALYYERCKATLHEFDLAAQVVNAGRAQISGRLRIATSLAFGRLAVMPALAEFMALHPQLQVDLECDDRFVDLIASGRDVALRMGSLADSTYGAAPIGVNPWIMVGGPAYLRKRGAPRTIDDLRNHSCIVYSSVQGNDVWRLSGPGGALEAVQLNARLRSNNLSVVLSAARAQMGVAILPHYVAAQSLAEGALQAVMTDRILPSQEIHAVTPSPRLIPRKVSLFIDFLRARFAGEWWLRAEGRDVG